MSAGALRGQGPVVAAVALGGVIGAFGRYGAALLWPVTPGSFPWSTFAVNASGCAVIGVFMALLDEGRAMHRLLRPFFATGVLGGFTTFSTYALEIRQLVDHGALATAVAYLGGTLFAALGGVWAATVLTRLVTARGIV